MGGKLESPSIEFGEDSDSMLVENLLASVSQHQRQKNAEQVKNRMRARVLNGYWCFAPVIGYKYETVPGHGKLLVPDEPVASILKEAMEGYALGQFTSQSEVARHLDSCPGFPKSPNGKVQNQFIHKILGKSIYAGYIDVPKWGIYLQPGKHEPLISFDTLKKIRNKMNGQAHAPARKDLNVDFPLRSFIICSTCGNPYTAGWSRGKLGGRYPYYLCYSKECPDRRKSIRKDKLEGEFEQLLQNLRPTQDLFFMAKEMFKDLWEERQDRAKADSGLLQNELKVIENKVEKFLGRIVETDNMTLVTTYENKVRKLEEEKIAINEKVRNCGRPLKTFDEAFEPAFRFLSNPYKLWESNRLEDKRAVLKLVFAERLPYDRNEGLRTPALSLPFCLTGQLKGNDYAMVGHKLLRTRNYRLDLRSGFDYKKFKNFQNGSTNSPDQISISSADNITDIYFGVSGNFSDSFNGQNTIDLKIQQGLGGTDATSANPSRTSADATTTVATFNVSRFQNAGFWDSFMILGLGGQLSSDRNLSPGLFAAGGFGTVRGFPLAQLSGDWGYTASAEYVVPVPLDYSIGIGDLTVKKVLSLNGFIEHGRVFAINNQSGERNDSITGVGGGAQLNVPLGKDLPTLNLAFNYGYPIGGPIPSDGSFGTVYVNGGVTY